MNAGEERGVHDREKQVMDGGEERDVSGRGGTGHERRGGADMIVVTGATGNAGSEVVRALTARGERVRAFVRDPGRARHVLGEDVELAVGDFADPASVRAALEGADALLLSCADDPRRVGWETAAIDAAAAAGVRRIVKLSAAAAEPGSPVAFWDWHGQVEQYLRSCGTDWVILRANWYMSNVLAAASAAQQDSPAIGVPDRIRKQVPEHLLQHALVTVDHHSGTHQTPLQAFFLNGPGKVGCDRIEDIVERKLAHRRAEAS